MKDNLILKIKQKRDILFILGVTTALFANSLRNGFVWDDWTLMVSNEAYRTLDLKRLFLTKANALEYLPFRDLTLAIDFQLWGMEPFGFHLTNLLIYLTGLAAVFKTVKILANIGGEEGKGAFIAFWTTLIFALHPLHVEVVNFIAARNNLLAALFMFLSFNVCMSGIRKKEDGLIVLSALLFIAAVFSKVSVIFYPLFLIVVFLFIPKTEASKKRKVLILLVFLIIDIIAIVVHFGNASETGMVNEGFIRYGSNNPVLLLVRALQIPFFYLKMLILPYPLSYLYQVSFGAGGYVLRAAAAGMALMMVITLVWLWRKRRPLFVLGVAWYFLSLGPVLNIFPTEPVVADRYAYFSVLGFGLLSAYLLKIFADKRRTILYGALGVIIIWSGIAFSRNMDWHDDLSLWESALSVNPNMPRVMLANALWARGRYDEALAHLKEEYARDGTFRYSQFLGKYLFSSGRYEEAIPFYKKALAEGGDSTKEAHLDLAIAFEKSGLDTLSLEQYLKTLETKDSDPLGRVDTMAKEGLDRIRVRFMPELNELRLRALERPQNLEAQASLALFLHNLGMYQEAEMYYLKALELGTLRWETWFNLGLVYMKLQKNGVAIESFQRSLRINPRNRDALNNIGICYRVMRDYRQAEKYYNEALAVDPNFFHAAFNLGRMYFIAGKSEKSKEYLSRARTLAKGNIGMEIMIDQYLRQMR